MNINYSLYYEKFHDASDAHYEAMADFLLRLLSPILRKLPKDAKIIDIGCGTGLLVNALQTASYHGVRGVDISPNQIAVAQQRQLPCEVVSVDYIYDLAEREPRSIDAIFLLDVLEHLEVTDQINFLTAANRLIKPEGCLVVSVPNANSTFGMRWRHGDWTHTSSFTEHSLEFVLRNAGFRSLNFHPYEFGTKATFPYLHMISFWVLAFRSVFRLIRRLEAMAELGREGLRIPLTLNLLVEARADHEVI